MRTKLRSKVTLLFMTFGLLLAVPAVALADRFDADADTLATATPAANTKAANQQPGTTQTYDFSAAVSETGANTAADNVFVTSSDKVTVNNTFAGDWINASGSTPSSFEFTAYGQNKTGTISVKVPCDAVVGVAKAMTVTLNATASNGNTLNGNPQTITYNITPTGSPAASCTPADTTAPVITPDVQGTQGQNGWYTSNVTVSWNVSDPESSITNKTGCDPTTISSDTAGQTLTCSATSAGGTDSKSVTIKRDATPPQVNLGGVSGTSGDNGWYKSVVTQTFNASDATSGLAGPASFTKSSGTDEGSAVKINSGPVSDNAGNTNPGIDSATFKIDLSDPTITASLNPPNPATSGWYNAVTGAPTVHYECADSVSDVASCTADHTFGNGENQSHTGTVTDQAGHSATTSVNNIDVDLIAPTKPNASFDRSPEDSAGGYFKNTVTVTYGGSTDSGSSDLAGYQPASETFSTSGTHPYSGVAKDNAGNESAAESGNVKVDATDPTLQITGCPTAPVLLNSTQSITVAASDADSGLVSNPSSPASLDTSSVGSKTKTVTVEDKVGHSKSDTCSYSVIYNWSGFFSPVDNLPVLNLVKGGSSVPLKFNLGGNQGMGILAAGYPKSSVIPCDSTAEVDAIETVATAGSSGLNFDSTTNQYNYIWKTDKAWTSGCRQVEVKLIDGTSHRANFKFSR